MTKVVILLSIYGIAVTSQEYYYYYENGTEIPMDPVEIDYENGTEIPMDPVEIEMSEENFVFPPLSTIDGVLETSSEIGSPTPFCKKTQGAFIESSTADIMYVYFHLRDNWNTLIDELKEDPHEEFLVSSIFGIILRVAFHDSGEYSALTTNDNFGPDGCLSVTEGNKGLVEKDSLIMTVVEDLWQTYCDRISRADFWALLGKFVAEKGDKTESLNIPFAYGRKDNTICESSGIGGRLPLHQPGFSELERVFVDQMQLSLKTSITLQGGHSVGHVHPEHSGFGFRRSLQELMEEATTNAWEETPAEFDSEYFKSLIAEPWVNVLPKNTTQNFWIVQEEGHELTIMLNSDMILGFFASTDNSIGVIGELCADDALDGEYGCITPDGQKKPSWPTPYDQCKAYVDSNEKFLKDWENAYFEMTTVGYSVDGYYRQGKKIKLGNLHSIKLPRYYEGTVYDNVHNEVAPCGTGETFVPLSSTTTIMTSTTTLLYGNPIAPISINSIYT